MYVGQLTLTQHGPSDREAASHAIYNLLYALRHSGQICGNEWLISRTPTGYRVPILLPEEEAFDALYHSDRVREALKKLHDAGLGELRCPVEEEAECVQVCRCEHASSYVLYTHFLSMEPPLRCGICFGFVPLYRLPASTEESYQSILCWESFYRACDTLFMTTTSLERTALRQLSRLDSGLSQDGLAVCRQISEATQIPTYYYLHRYNARSLKQEKKRLCPSCQGEWLLSTPWHRFDFKCDRCHLVSSIA